MRLFLLPILAILATTFSLSAQITARLGVGQPESPHKGQASFSANRQFSREPQQPFMTDLEPFFHGVASGDPLADRVIIWTRVTPEVLDEAPISVDYVVATDPTLTDTVTTGQVVTNAARDYTVKVDVTGLASGTTYYYGFSALGANSLTGRTKTTPTADEAERLKFGVVSCSNYQAGYFNAYGLLADRNDLDAIVHLGDYIYEYANFVYGSDSIWDERTVAPDAEIVSLGDYRTRYGTYRLDTNLIRAHQQHPIISVWDDHESTNDSYVDGAENHQPDTEGDWESRKDRARQVYFEWMPIRDNGNRSIYRNISYGDLADLIMLDTRLEGRDKQLTSVLDTALLDTTRTILGEQQRNWFFDQLSSSTAKWKIVGQQVIFSEFNVGWAAADGQTYADVESIFLDIWDGYPAERQRVVEHIAGNDIDNVVLLTGDFHSSFAFEVAVPSTNLVFTDVPGVGTLPFYNPSAYDPATGAGAIAVEFATPSITAANFDENVGAATAAGLEFQINQPIVPAPGLSLGNPNPHMKYNDLDRHGYYILDVSDTAVQADYFYTDILVPNLAENFGTGLVSACDTSFLQTAAAPAPPKTIQDEPAPEDPPLSTSVRTLDGLQVMSLYPNPADDFVQFQFGLLTAGPVTISVVDLTGRTVVAPQTRNYGTGLYIHRVETAGLPAGQYVLRIATAQGAIGQPFVKW